mgnify:FL=1
MYWAMGEQLYLPKEIEAAAMEQQESHRELSGKEGIIQDFLEKPIPSNWDSMALFDRRMFWNGNKQLPDGATLVPREKVCAVEIWVECFNSDAKYMKRSDSTEINNILTGIKGWRRNKSVRRFGPYGTQKGFERM